VNGTSLAVIVTALLGGGGAAALIQLFLLPRTMARTRADTTQVLVGTATDTVALVNGQLGRANEEIGDLRNKLAEARGRMAEQDAQISGQRVKIEEQNTRISALTVETDTLRDKIALLEARVQAATEVMNGIGDDGA
jgi:chromosome segregation ATPase